jgi:putative ABC transport system ATP-binding protein
LPGKPLFELQSVRKSYALGGETISVFSGLDLAIAEGEFLSLMGPSGSGKSTLLNLLGGLDRPGAGRILFDGARMDQLSPAELTAWRSRNIGFIFQSYNLIPFLSAERNVELPLLLTRLGRRERLAQVATALGIVRLEDRARHRPSELSGGQQQRVAIARAIVSDPRLLLADEPTGDLDRDTADEIMQVLATLNRELGKTIVMVTHDPKAAAYASRRLHLDKGVIAETDGGG